MKRIEFIRKLLAGVSAVFIPGWVIAGKSQKLPDVLLLGDSISIGYTPFTEELLRGKANVYRPLLSNGNPENCSGTTSGIANIDRWISQKKWDVIHFNFGLHDIKHINPETGEATKNPDDPLQADIRQYIKNMKFIVSRLKLTGADLIFATTTPVPGKLVSPLREPENVIRYNKAAVRIMKKEKIIVNDLYMFALPILTEIQRPENVHFTDNGSKLLAEEVVKKITLFL